MKQNSKSETKTKKTKKTERYLVQWGGYDDPVEIFETMERAKDKVQELIEEDTDIEDIYIHVISKSFQPKSSTITYEETVAEID